ncbi:MAG: MBL fold metallo-hydrolase [Paracoccaceae bacterium]
MRLFLSAALVVLTATLANAATSLQVTKVADNVYAIVGPFGQRDAENLGNNATFGLVVTDDGAVLIDAGGSRNGAEALHAAIRTVTDQPVTHVINTGGQDHRWLGNAYWQAQGATVIASDAAAADQQARASMQMTMLSQLIGDALDGTEPSDPDVTFANAFTLTVGDTVLEITHPGPAHTPGDSFVWMPSESVMFTGDIVFVGRLLGVLEFSSSAGWVDAFEVMAAHRPAHVVPGHGPPTDLATARHDTYDYLVNLRDRIDEYMAAGGDIIGSVDVDQSAFSGLHDFDLLARRNAQQVFSQMEWE